MKRWTIALAALGVLVLGWAWGSPYVTLWQLKKAADARDLGTLSAHVDYPAVRASLKQQLRARVADQREGGLGGLARMVADRFGDPLVDAAVTPEGMRIIFATSPTAEDNSGPQRTMGLDAGKMTVRRETLTRFALEPRDDNGTGTELVFGLHGLGWKLIGVRLR
ncbi:DUF2939 domain-containing protein [Sphingomonas sp. CJ20]